MFASPRGSEISEVSTNSSASSEDGSVLVSVIIPAYRCAEYIVRGIESVLNQSFTKREILVVNDGSPDTAELEKALAPYAGMVRYFKQPAMGPSAARNTGIRNAFGKYVAFLNGCDFWTPDHMTKVMSVFEGDPGVALVFCNSILVNDSEPVTGGVDVHEPGVVRFERLLLQNHLSRASSVVAFREAILTAGGFDEQLFHCEDFDMLLRLAHSGNNIVYYPDSVVYHRVRDVDHSAENLAMLNERVRVYEKAVATLPLSQEQRKVVRRMVTKSQSKTYIAQLKDALDREDYLEANEAAHRALSLESAWRARLTILGLRLGPRAFRFLRRAGIVLP